MGINNMTKKELLSNLYQIQEFMGSGIFEVQVEEDDDIDENINEDLQEALDEAVECIEWTYNSYKAMKEETNNVVDVMKIKAIQNLINKEKTDVSKK